MAQSEIPEDEFHLTITGHGVNVDRLIDGQTLAAVMAFVMGADKLATRGPVGTSDSFPSADGADVQASLREFLDEAQAKRKPDQIVTIGHYITQFKGREDFSRDEVKARFSIAREPMPANFPRDFALAEKSGMLAEVHGKEGRYYITKTGLGAINNKFSKEKANLPASQPKSKGAKVGNRSVAADGATKNRAKSKKLAGAPIKASLEALLDEGFFSEFRTLAQIVERLHELAINAKVTSLSGPVADLVRNKKLERKKADGNGKQIWAYRALRD